MTTDAEQIAREKVNRFVRRFDESYRVLAYYAALPLILTPELLNYLRNHFLRGQVPWVAEADLLLSDLCEPVGYEQYAMTQSVRACLLADMRQQLGAEQLQHVARLLIAHVNQLLRHPPALSEQALRAERWSAMAYLTEQRGTVASEIAASFRKLLVPETNKLPAATGLLSTAELAQLSRITEMLAPQLESYPALLDYAREISRLLSNDPERLAAVAAEPAAGGTSVGVEVMDVTLPSLNRSMKGLADEALAHRPKYDSCFISYSWKDSDFAHQLRKKLTSNGIKVWLDRDQNITDEVFQVEMPKAIQTSDKILICCSANSLVSEWVNRELEITLQTEQQRQEKGSPSGQSIIIPLDLDGHIRSTKNPLAQQLLKRQIVDFTGWERNPEIFTEQAETLLNALKREPSEHANTGEKPSRSEATQLITQLDDPSTDHKTRAKIGDRLAEIGDPRPGVGLTEHDLPDIVWLPVSGLLTVKEKHFDIDPFYIAKYPVTWAQYRAFTQAKDGYRDKRWWENLNHQPKPGRQRWKVNNRPAENISWYDAVAYCRWLSEKLGYDIRLPTEQEWQLAATGGDEREFPWGNEWRSELANTFESGLSRTTAVGLYLGGASPVGALDMAGNVWEWCLNQYDKPPSDTTINDSDAARVLRGGSWLNYQVFARAAYRLDDVPGLRFNSFGFRLCSSSPII